MTNFGSVFWDFARHILTDLSEAWDFLNMDLLSFISIDIVRDVIDDILGTFGIDSLTPLGLISVSAITIFIVLKIINLINPL